MVENPVLSGSIRMEGMQEFLREKKKHQYWMDKDLSQTAK